MSSTVVEGLPDEFVQRFRQLVAERLTRAESLWFSLLQGTGHDAEAAELLRLVHTLKGDAGVIGLTDVHLVCHELEELLDVAKDVAWAVPDDLDLLVTMSFHFIGLLARRPAGAPVAGIDLAGFVQEVDQAVRATRALERFAGTGANGSLAAAPDGSPDQESRLARAATLAFLEHLGARGASRERLHQLWKLLRQEVAQSSSTPLGRLVERHVGATKELGEQLGKLVDVEVEVRGLSVTRRVADALDVGFLHGIRNAVDHGLEPPHERTGAGKPPRGRIRITAAVEGDVVEVAVEDDGRGFDHAAIVQRALDSGLVGEAERSEARLDVHELVFRAGFSTAHRPGRISGRGVGLDAARAALGKVGGEVTARARDGGGARIVMRVPALVHHMQVYVFEARPGLPIAIPATWVVTVSPEPEGTEAPGVRTRLVIDPLETLGIAAQLDRGDQRVDRAEHVLMLRRGLLHAHFAATSLPRLVTAQRICPTTASDPMEVVMVQGQEVLVLRPEQLAGAALLDGWRSPPRAT